MVYREGPSIGIRVASTGTRSFVADFLDVANNFLDLVNEVDSAVSGQFVRTADWAFRELSYASPAVLSMEPIVREGQDDNRQAIVDAAVQGIDNLKTTDNRPRYFSDQALTSARRIVSTLGDRVDRVEIFSDRTTVGCTEAIAAHVRAIFRPGRELLGSIEGRLEAMNSHEGFKFAVYEPVLASRIEGELASDTPAETRDAVIDLYETRVRVTGTLRTNAKGEVKHASVNSIEGLRTEARFRDASEVSGLYDITDGQTAAEYIRGMRDAE